MQHAVELRLVAQLFPAGMVDVDLAPLLVAPGHLDVPVLVRADPDLCPGRRTGQLLEALPRLRAGDAVALWIQIGEARSLAAAHNARLLVGDGAEAGRAGGGPG